MDLEGVSAVVSSILHVFFPFTLLQQVGSLTQ